MLWRLVYALVALICIWLLLSLIVFPYTHIVEVLALIAAIVYVVFGDRLPR